MSRLSVSINGLLALLTLFIGATEVPQTRLPYDTSPIESSVGNTVWHNDLFKFHDPISISESPLFESENFRNLERSAIFFGRAIVNDTFRKNYLSELASIGQLDTDKEALYRLLISTERLSQEPVQYFVTDGGVVVQSFATNIKQFLQRYEEDSYHLMLEISQVVSALAAVIAAYYAWRQGGMRPDKIQIIQLSDEGRKAVVFKSNELSKLVIDPVILVNLRKRIKDAVEDFTQALSDPSVSADQAGDKYRKLEMEICTWLHLICDQNKGKLPDEELLKSWWNQYQCSEIVL